MYDHVKDLEPFIAVCCAKHICSFNQLPSSFGPDLSTRQDKSAQKARGIT